MALTEPFPLLDDQHQRGRMVPAILADLRVVAARLFPEVTCATPARLETGRCPVAGAPVAVLPPAAAGASLFDPFHAPEVSNV
ncbi:hypothetical protein HNO88_002984 [Novosphingobium chloroacetimidivorans]|uniref:Uncharacterized protein n=1 Tax=Novosphingobium chloroacetimidivorans TaxID=1428314 RepID=A0A7W7NXX2_9SPHN|nr:hypothetical protein [Novosphingobium chloroacetimidivorans]MBB4859655.1 hypothetical protein [Novosphingobium chloroacetimidivorans]